jgi:hypothetical protein
LKKDLPKQALFPDCYPVVSEIVRVAQGEIFGFASGEIGC